MGWSWVALATSGNKRTRHRPCPRREVESDRIPELLGEMEQVGPCRGRGSPWGIDRPAPTEDRLLVIADAASRAGVFQASRRTDSIATRTGCARGAVLRGPASLQREGDRPLRRRLRRHLSRYRAGCSAVYYVPRAFTDGRGAGSPRRPQSRERRRGGRGRWREPEHFEPPRSRCGHRAVPHEVGCAPAR